eukprot:Amastigsp_a414_1007.p2 type:complete len:146 gc:universal Amastigsp_a414_1007:140-577(+)
MRGSGRAVGLQTTAGCSSLRGAGLGRGCLGRVEDNAVDAVLGVAPLVLLALVQQRVTRRRLHDLELCAGRRDVRVLFDSIGHDALDVVVDGFLELHAVQLLAIEVLLLFRPNGAACATCLFLAKISALRRKLVLNHGRGRSDEME